MGYDFALIWKSDSAGEWGLPILGINRQCSTAFHDMSQSVSRSIVILAKRGGRQGGDTPGHPGETCPTSGVPPFSGYTPNFGL